MLTQEIGRVPDKVLLALAVLIAFGYIAGTSLTTGFDGSLVQGDARAYFAYLPSLVFDRDVTLNDEFEILRPEGRAQYPYGEGPHGRAANPFPVAPAILWLPGYIAGLAAESVVTTVRGSRQPAGYGPVAVWGAAMASILVAGAGAILTRRLIANSIGARDSLSAVVATWLGTAALYYTLITPLYSHATSWFGVASMLYATCIAGRQPFGAWRWLIAGFFAGYMVAIRLPDAVLLVMPAFILGTAGWHDRRNWQACASCAPAWIAGAIAGYLPQAIVSYHVYGRLAPSSPAELGRTFQSGVLVDALFSSRYEGWISWTPVVVFALAGLFRSARHSPSADGHRLTIAAVLGVIALYLVDVMHPYARPGAAFGARRYVSGSPLIAIGIAGMLNVTEGRSRRWTLALLFALVAWNVWLLTSYELLVNIYRVYPTLGQTIRFAIGLGSP
jgi:hypothetical protein